VLVGAMAMGTTAARSEVIIVGLAMMTVGAAGISLFLVRRQAEQRRVRSPYHSTRKLHALT
jgi:hypothetical protein